MTRPPLWTRLLAVLVSSALLTLTVAPYHVPHVHWFALVPLFWALRDDTPRSNRWLVLLHGVVTTAGIYVWIAQTITLFSNIPWPLAWAILGLFSAVYGLIYPLAFGWTRAFRRRFGSWWVLALPAWVVLVEWLQTFLWLFPYQQGVSQYQTPYTFQIVSITGIWGMSFVVVFVNAALAEAVYRRAEARPVPWTWLGSAAALLAAVVGFSAWRFHAMERALEAAPVRRVLQVQWNEGMIFRLSNPSSVVFDFWVDAVREHEGEDVDLVVLPEGAIPYQLNASSASSVLWDLVERLDADLLAGSGTRERERDPRYDAGYELRMFNSTYFFDRQDLAVADDVVPPADLWARLRDGDCDLDADHVFTVLEARALAEVGSADVEGTACREALAARAASLDPTGAVSPRFVATVAATPEAWGRLRTLTARFDTSLEPGTFRSRRGTTHWSVSEAGCDTGDCRTITARCDMGGCTVHPEAPHYDKMVPLPFGEYIPFSSTFPWLADLIEGPGDFRAGTEPMVFDHDGVRFATPICYEAILPYVCRRFVDPDLFVNVTNDAWFGTGAASELHGMLAAIRATEFGVPVFRSAYSGVSFVAEPHGVITHQTELFTRVSRVVPVRMATADTPYKRFGDWFVALCAGIFVVLGVRFRDPEMPETPMTDDPTP